MNFPTGVMAWYVIGRFYTDANGTAFDAGYFPQLIGLPGPFFKGDSSNESTAYFTFYADKFTPTSIQNGNVSAALAPPGTWSMYLLEEPTGNWQNPESFEGRPEQKIAIWQRISTSMSTSIGTAGLSLLSFELKESFPFTWQGQHYDLRNVLPSSVTQMGFSSSELLDPLTNYPYVKAFTASAFRNQNQAG